MKEEIYGVITFKSTHHTIQFENFLNEEEIHFKTIPTPREITKSCGLAILFNLDDLNYIKDIIEKNEVKIEAIYKYTKSKLKSSAEKII